MLLTKIHTHSLCLCAISVFPVLPQAVSKSLRSLVEADSVTSVKENTLDKGVSSSSVKVQTAVLSEHQDHNSEAAETKTSDDDIMVQIRAGKSEVGLCQHLCSLFRH